jgi:hypothetical protein
MWTFTLTADDNESVKLHFCWLAELVTELFLRQRHNQMPLGGIKMKQFHELAK